MSEEMRIDAQYDLIVIGGGTAGLTAAMDALELGVERIALVEKDRVGGECAYYACVPTKTLLTATRHLVHMRHQAPLYGIDCSHPTLDFSRLMAKVTHVVHEGGYDFLDDPRITLVHGEARFISPEVLEVNGLHLAARAFVIATGGAPKVPKNIDGLEESGFLTYQDAVTLEALPESLLIVGGGAVGVEFAQFFASAGSHVTLFEHNDRILPKEEPEISAFVRQILEQEGVRVLTGCNIRHVAIKEGQRRLSVEQQGKSLEVEGAELLMATGTRPVFKSLALDAAGIEWAERGIRVNDGMQTSSPRIWAVGDVVDSYRFTHVADYQAVVAVRNALGSTWRKVDYHAVPWAIFTEPAVARVGLTEAQAREQYRHVTVLHAEASEVSRYRIESEHRGFAKIIVDTDTHRPVGAHMAAFQADDIIHLMVLAIQNAMTVHQLLDMIFIYPAKSQILQKALEKYPCKPLPPVTKKEPQPAVSRR